VITAPQSSFHNFTIRLCHIAPLLFSLDPHWREPSIWVGTDDPRPDEATRLVD
jgi:hypothetical protein